MSDPKHELETLREILLAQDREKLEALREEVERLKAKIDNPEAFLQVIEPVIAEALAQRTRTHPKEVAQALAPIISDAVRLQIRENRDAFVSAMVPIMGPLISRTVQEAIQALARRVDEQIRRATSFQFLLKRWWARLRGIPPEEIVLREALPWTPVSVLIIDNKSGIILTQVYREGEEFGKDPDLAAGLLTAIRNFARETFTQNGDAPQGTLYELRVDSHTVLMEEGPGFYVAWVGIGVPPMNAHERLQELIGVVQTAASTTLWTANGETPPFLMEFLEKEFLQEEEVVPEESGGVPKVGIALITAALAGILLLCGWGAYRLAPRAVAHVLPTAVTYLTPTVETYGIPLADPLPAVLTQATAPRLAPDPRAQPLGTILPNGATVYIVAEYEDTWAQIAYPTAEHPRIVGWVPKSMLKPQAP